MEHEHNWVPLGTLEVCTERGCASVRATTEAADFILSMTNARREKMEREG